jgi:hypothetical protein
MAVSTSSFWRLGRWLENYFLEHLLAQRGGAALHEGPDGAGNIIGISALGDGGGNKLRITAASSAQYSASRRQLETDLVSQLTPVVVVGVENLAPGFQSPVFDEIPGLLLE